MAMADESAPAVDPARTAAGDPNAVETGAGMGGRVPVIDALRGLAAISVAWFHFTLSYANLDRASYLKRSGQLGWLGVEVFFVISGFVIPFALHRTRFEVKRHWRSFLAKRILRIDPPYFVSILLVIVLAHLSALAPAFRGSPPAISAYRIALHMGYLISFVGNEDWLIPVYWSLAIEFQYYLLAILIFPLIASGHRAVRLAVMAGLLVLAGLILQHRLVFAWLSLFSLGISCFQYRVGLASRIEHVAVGMASAVVCYATHGGLIATVATLTALMISLWRWPVPYATKLGLISYSLYLVHVPIGGRIVNLGGRLSYGIAYDLIVLLVALLASLLAAYAFYTLIERPFLRLSARIKYA
jgi:peptidoglycan/LPS O-acetylase OafA/YrhL